ncbi:uncharacterized protein LOC111004689 isoform X1 [Momordica charantia]|uniref:Uncharacterized protein LOC111004689 isoform X1 n=1 Tax=Momordica charantia TaxID=3673 RepID=A0A6J1BR78_MOMCH|nr:uncharacterized protein LOC111004689 isoform X1 [Momordica charantia]
MTRCFSFIETKTWCHRYSFSKCGLQSTITDLKDGTIVHCWVPKKPNESKPNLLLIHGIGANALWQWGDVIRGLVAHFNVYVPDLIFFGNSFTTRPERTEWFQAECVIRVMEANSVGKLSLVGISYGGFVGYSVAALYPEMVEKVVICCSGVCVEEKDFRDGLLRVSDLEEATKILVPQKPEKLKELVAYSFFRPPPLRLMLTCLLNDFIESMCLDYIEEKRELIRAIPKERKLSDLPKIHQRTMILWGEHDQVFPLELGHRLKQHLGDNATLVIIKNAGHAFTAEEPKEFYNHLKSFLVDS